MGIPGRMFWVAIAAQKRISKIMGQGKDKTNDQRVCELRKLGEKLGISGRDVRDKDGGSLSPQIVIERIQAAARTHRDGVGWLIAFVTAVAAIVSAAAALIAVLG